MRTGNRAIYALIGASCLLTQCRSDVPEQRFTCTRIRAESDDSLGNLTAVGWCVSDKGEFIRLYTRELTPDTEFIELVVKYESGSGYTYHLQDVAWSIGEVCALTSPDAKSQWVLIPCWRTAGSGVGYAEWYLGAPNDGKLYLCNMGLWRDWSVGIYRNMFEIRPSLMRSWASHGEFEFRLLEEDEQGRREPIEGVVRVRVMFSATGMCALLIPGDDDDVEACIAILRRARDPKYSFCKGAIEDWAVSVLESVAPKYVREYRALRSAKETKQDELGRVLKEIAKEAANSLSAPGL